MGQFSLHECFYSIRYFISIFCFWKCGCNNLVNHLLSMRIRWVKYLCPERNILSFYKISCLHSIKIIFIGDFNKFIITFTPCSFISSKSKIWISLFTIFTNNFGIIILIVNKECLWILVDVNIYLCQSIMECCILDSLITSGFQPCLEHSQPTLCLKLIHQVWDWTHPN